MVFHFEDQCSKKATDGLVTLLCHAIALYHVTCVSQSCAFKSMCSERFTSLVSVEAVMTSLIKSLGFQLPL